MQEIRLFYTKIIMMQDDVFNLHNQAGENYSICRKSFLTEPSCIETANIVR